MTERQWVDGSDRTALAVCSCGWRELRSDRSAALAAAAAHAMHAHPGDLSAASRRSMYRNRS